MLYTIVLATFMSAAPADLEVITAQVERAVTTSDVDYLRELEAQLHGDDPTERYTRAYVHWRMSYAVGPDRRDEHDEHLKQARAILEDLVENDPDHAEAQALLGSVIGGQITNVFKGMMLGPKSSSALDRASQLAPDSPRVALLQGISAVFTPGMFGGGLDKAEEKLREAEALFAKESPSKPWPFWGRADVQAWLGQVLAKNGDLDGARAAYEKGLAMEPDHSWIRNVLLPQLDELN